jgi:outer membrane receptor protein involved in Fe transport
MSFIQFRTLQTSLVCSAILTSLSSAPLYAAQEDNKINEKKIEHIVVTSRKKEETIIEIPMSVSSISAMEIVDRNYTYATDIYRTLAGAAMPRNELILRGLSGGNTTAPDTTAVFTDNIPLEFNNLADIERVEVLRGPQGTLYGSNAIGGTVRIITKKPVMNEFQLFGSMQATSEKNVYGYDTNFSLGINIPLIDDSLALRINGNIDDDKGAMVNAFTGAQAGSIDNFIRSQLLWTPSNDVSINLGFVQTEYSEHGAFLGDRSKPGGYLEPIFEKNENSPYGYDVSERFVECDAHLERAACLNGGENITDAKDKYTVYDLIDNWAKNKLEVYTLTLIHENILDIASLTYAGSFRQFEGHYLDDWSRLDGDDMFRTWIIGEDHTKRTTHEIRLQNIDVNSPLSWTIGMFSDKFTVPETPDNQWQYHEGGDKMSALINYWWDEDVTALGKEEFDNPNKNWNYAVVEEWMNELAFFADVAYSLETDSMGTFEFGSGIRWFDLEDYSHTVSTGIWDNDTTVTAGQEDGNRLKFSASWMPSDDMSVYALYSEGYRPGGNNGPLAQSCSDDPKAANRKDRYNSDQIENKEIGFKASLFNNTFNFTSAIYQIDWTSIKTDIYMDTCGFSYTANGGEARSRGIEFESTAQLTDNLTMTFNTSYTDSYLTLDNDAIDGKAGDDMTMVPKYNAYLAFDQAIKVMGKDAYIRLDMTAYGEYKTHFDTLPTDEVESYEVFNLSGRMELSDTVQLSVHVNNLLDSEIVTYKRARSRNAESTAQQYISYLPERNVTVRLDYTFF